MVRTLAHPQVSYDNKRKFWLTWHVVWSCYMCLWKHTWHTHATSVKTQACHCDLSTSSYQISTEVKRENSGSSGMNYYEIKVVIGSLWYPGELFRVNITFACWLPGIWYKLLHNPSSRKKKRIKKTSGSTCTFM